MPFIVTKAQVDVKHACILQLKEIYETETWIKSELLSD
jgi:hypothetical protein